MKDILIDFDDMKSGEKALRKIAQAFTRAGAPVVATDVDPKVKRSSGVSYRDAYLTFGDNQKLTLGIKAGGDVYQVKINGSVVPIKNQDDQKKAVAELVKHLDAGRAKFQQKLARVKAELPKGVRATAPKVEVALQQRSTQLDTEIAQAQQQVEALKAELGDAPGAPAPGSTPDNADGDGGATMVDAANFSAMRGHVAAGTVIRFAKGRKLTLKSTMRGWVLVDAAGNTFAGPMPTAAQVEGTVVRMDNEGALDSVSLDEARELAATILGGAILDSAGMDHALATLQIALDAAENNAPIYAAEGDADQAQLCRESAQSFREAIAMLDSAESVLDGADRPLTKKQLEIVGFIKDQLNIDLSGAASFLKNKIIHVDAYDNRELERKMPQVKSLGMKYNKFKVEDNGDRAYAIYLTDDKALDSAEEDEEESQEPSEDQGSLFDEADEEAVEPNPDQASLFDAVPASVGNKLAEIGKTYWATIPLDKIFAAVRSAGYEPVDEDGEPWEGMLTGREGRAVIDLQKSGKPVKEALALQWYKMESGKFEVNAYVS